MSKLLLSTAAALAIFTALGAIAQEAAAPALPDGCKAVTVSRPDIDPARPDIPLTFRGEGSNVVAVKACNPEGATAVIGVNPSKTAGARVIVRTANGAGIVGLPAIYAAGDVHNITCRVEEGKMEFALYRLDWRDGLPERLALVAATPEGDSAIHVAGCLAAATPDILAQLKGGGDVPPAKSIGE